MRVKNLDVSVPRVSRVAVDRALIQPQCFLEDQDYLQYPILPLEEDVTQIELDRKPETNQLFEEELLLYTPVNSLTTLSVSMWLNCLQKRASCFLCSSDMKATLLSVLGMIFTLRGTGAQTVTQPEDCISVFEGNFVQVKCNYSYSGSPVLFWYVQYPKRGLQLLLKHISGESIKGFTASLNKDETSFHLKKQSAQEEDSATYYCALRDTVTGFIREAEHKPFLELQKVFPHKYIFFKDLSIL
ncbi:uncharacterized protein [Callorhinus ursinus]|uniref:uncharacterized protein n=1 Tax=Callorhinus ursinus TaxID=34884 RepID=UPI003CD034FF